MTYKTIKTALFIIYILFIESIAYAQFATYKDFNYQYTPHKKSYKLISPIYVNRIEGITPFIGFSKAFFYLYNTSIYGTTGYGFTDNQWKYSIGIEKILYNKNRLLLNGEYFNTTATNDDWKLTLFENSLAYFFFREDFFDYYWKKGFRLFADQLLFQKHHIRIEYSQYDYKDIGASTGFAKSLFTNKKVPINPHITEGDETSVKIYIYINNMEERNRFLGELGWHITCVYEKTMDDFKTDGIFLSGNYSRLLHNIHKAHLTILAGSRTGKPEPQHLISFGGIGSLTAFPDRFKHSQHCICSRIEYDFSNDIFIRTRLIRYSNLENLAIRFFIEPGNAWSSADNDNYFFNGISRISLLTDVGISVLMRDVFRFDLSRQLSHGFNNWRITMRLNKK